MSTEILNYSSGKISAKLERSSKILLSDVHFSVSSGESVALIGETGSGKTMAALSIMGLLPTNVTMLDSRIIFCRREADPNGTVKNYAQIWNLETLLPLLSAFSCTCHQQ